MRFLKERRHGNQSTKIILYDLFALSLILNDLTNPLVAQVVRDLHFTEMTRVQDLAVVLIVGDFAVCETVSCIRAKKRKKMQKLQDST